MEVRSSDNDQLNSSDPPDYDPTKMQEEGGKDPDLEDMEEDFPIKVEDWVAKELLSFSRKKKKAHERWFGDNNGYAERILNWWKAYDGKTLPGQTNPGNVPIPSSIVETDMAKTYQALFSRAKVVDAQPRSPQANNENKTTVEDLVNQELLFGMSRTGEKALGWLKAMKIEGTSIFRAKWEKRCIETIPSPSILDQATGETVQIKTVAEVKIFKDIHGPDFDADPVQNVIWDPRCEERIQDSEYAALRQFPTLTDLLIMQENGTIQNVDQIQKLSETQQPDQINPDAKRKKLLGPQGNGPDEGSVDEPVKRLDEWFAWVPLHEPQDDGTKKWTKRALHWMIVNDEVLVMAEPDPWVDERGYGPLHPFFSARQGIQPREMLGKGVLAPVMDMAAYVNRTHGSMEKLVSKAAKNPTFVSRAAGLDTLRLFQDELAIIPVMDPKAVSYHPIDGQQIKAVGEERAWGINMMRDTVAANEQAQGVSNKDMSDATATEASIINANSGTRFQLIVDQLGYEFFAAYANIMWWMIRQWAKDGDLVVRESSIDGAPRPILREHLVDDYFFVPITSAVLNDQRAQLQAKMQFAQQMSQLQATNPQALVDDDGLQYSFELLPFLRQEIMPLMGVRNGFTYFKKVQPMMPPQPGQPPVPGQPGANGGAPGMPEAPGVPAAKLPAHPGTPTPPVKGPIPPQVMGRPALPVAPQPGFGPQGPFHA